MGSPKFTRSKYSTPSHPWESERIQAENELKKQYGLKNKREIWKANSKLRAMRHQARRIIAQSGSDSKQIELEKEQQLARHNRYGLLDSGANFSDILTLELGNLLARRLQTVVYHKGLASTMKQARQFIIHGHIEMGGRIVRTPSQLVPKGMQESIAISQYSPISDEEHPVRVKTTPEPDRDRDKGEGRDRAPRQERTPAREEKAEPKTQAKEEKTPEPAPTKAPDEVKAGKSPAGKEE